MEEIENLKNHLNLCVAVLENIAEQAGVDLSNTQFKISMEGNGQTASIPIGSMVQKWKEISK